MDLKAIPWKGENVPIFRVDLDDVELGGVTHATLGFAARERGGLDFGTQVDVWFELDNIGTVRSWGGQVYQVLPTPLGLKAEDLLLPEPATDAGEPWVISEIHEDVADGSILWTSHEAREYAKALIAAADAADLAAGQE